METLLWMIYQASVPMILGVIMALSLSRWSQLSSRVKVRLGMCYEGMLLIGQFVEPMRMHDWIYNMTVQLRGGVEAAFGLCIGISLLRLSATWKGRVAGGLFVVLYLTVLYLGFEAEFQHVFRRLVHKK